jgi:hypothetical protein
MLNFKLVGCGRISKRHPLQNILQKKSKLADTQTRVYYPIALPKLKAFKYLGQEDEVGMSC